MRRPNLELEEKIEMLLAQRRHVIVGTTLREKQIEQNLDTQIKGYCKRYKEITGKYYVSKYSRDRE